MFLLLLFFFLFFIVPNIAKPHISNMNDACPPHKWRWVEVKDKEGNLITHRLECLLCGPLKKQE